MNSLVPRVDEQTAGCILRNSWPWECRNNRSPKVITGGRAGGNPALKSRRLGGIFSTTEENQEPSAHMGGEERRGEGQEVHIGSYGNHLLPSPQILES